MSYPSSSGAARARLNTTGATSKPRAALQGRLSEQDMEPYASKHACSTHQVEYYIPAGHQVICPVCDLEAVAMEVRGRVTALTNELEMARNQLKRLQPQVDLKSAISQAIEVLNDEDYLWLKTQMYQYKIDKSVMLKVTHGKLQGGRKLKRGESYPANGFIAIPRQGEPEGYIATSFGGLAMADYLDEAITTFGQAQAMGIMLKAWWRALPGGAQ